LTEAGSEAINHALDELTWRSGAVRNIFLYTDEDDDAGVSLQGEKGRRGREPPRRGPKARGRWLTRWQSFQARVDATADRLIANQVLLHMVVNFKDRPTTFQYGDPRMTETNGDGGLDPVGTLSALVSKSQDRSLQGQLLASGECRGNGVCTGGRVGSPCVVDSDCALTARAYQIPRNDAQADALFPGLIADILEAQICVAP
jgi:hypothetical protein